MLEVKSDFPIFTKHPELIYLDSAATAQKPQIVLDAVEECYTNFYANAHRGLYPIGVTATERYETVRSSVAGFINGKPEEIVFTKGTTEGLNLLAYCLGSTLEAGDEIILSHQEHHANLLPWRVVAEQRNLKIVYLPLTKSAEIDINALPELITPKTKIISLTVCSNVLGTITPLTQIKKILTEQGSSAHLIIDAAQAAPHYTIDVQTWGADFIVFSGHKLYAPSGIGVLWGKKELLEALPPYQTGGQMIRDVTLATIDWADSPQRFEAGTQNLEGVVGLGAAIDYLTKIGMDKITEHTAGASRYVRKLLEEIPEMKLLNDPAEESGIVSFTVKGIHPHDLADLLGQRNICIRAGQHCTGPLHEVLGIEASCRISIGIYTSKAAIETSVATIKEIIQDFQHA